MCARCKARERQRTSSALRTDFAQDLVGLVDDEVLARVQVERALPHQRQKAAGGGHHNVGRVRLQQLAVLRDGHAWARVGCV